MMGGSQWPARLSAAHVYRRPLDYTLRRSNAGEWFQEEANGGDLKAKLLRVRCWKASKF
ncbi:hypothetical protein OROGR_029599 [Orobanche gracilis]